MKNPILRGIALFLFVTFIVFALVLAAPSLSEGKTTPSNPKKSFDANANPNLEFDYQKNFNLIKYVTQMLSDPTQAKAYKIRQ